MNFKTVLLIACIGAVAYLHGLLNSWRTAQVLPIGQYIDIPVTDRVVQINGAASVYLGSEQFFQVGADGIVIPAIRGVPPVNWMTFPPDVYYNLELETAGGAVRIAEHQSLYVVMRVTAGNVPVTLDYDPLFTRTLLQIGCVLVVWWLVVFLGIELVVTIHPDARNKWVQIRDNVGWGRWGFILLFLTGELLAMWVVNQPGMSALLSTGEKSGEIAPNTTVTLKRNTAKLAAVLFDSEVDVAGGYAYELVLTGVSGNEIKAVEKVPMLGWPDEKYFVLQGRIGPGLYLISQARDWSTIDELQVTTGAQPVYYQMYAQIGQDYFQVFISGVIFLAITILVVLITLASADPNAFKAMDLSP